MTLPTLDCNHCGSDTVFAFLIGDAGVMYLCQHCFDRLKVKVLQMIQDEALSQAMKSLSFSRKYGE